MTSPSACYSSYFPSIPLLINTSGILFNNYTNNKEKLFMVTDFVNSTIYGKGLSINNVGISGV
jgi:hypothetical protein